MSNNLITADSYKESLLVQIRESVTDKMLADMKAYCESLSIAGINDKQGYDLVQKAITKVVKTRTAVDAKRKELKAPFKEMGEAIDAEAKRITAMIASVEEPLKAKKKEIDDFAEAERQRLELEKQARYETRVRSMSEIGVTFNTVFFQAGVLNYSVTQVKEWTDEEFATEFTKMQAECELQRQAEERRRQAQEEAERQARDAQEKALQLQREAEDRIRQAEAVAAEQARKLAEAEARLAQMGFQREEPIQAPSPEPMPEIAPAPQFDAQPVRSRIPRTDAYMHGFNDAKRLILQVFTSEAHTKAEWINIFQTVEPE